MSPWRRVARVLTSLTIAIAAGGGMQASQEPASGTLLVTVSAGTNDRGLPIARRHALLVSEEPPSRAPRRVVTGIDGAGRLKLPPGTYIVESEEPLVASGQTFEWRQSVVIAAGESTTLALSSANAEIGATSADAATNATPGKIDQWDLLIKWQESVVPLWTPTTHAAGVVVGPGLLVTTQRAVGTATTVEAQLTPTLKLAARVIAADESRNVAVLWLDAASISTRASLSFGCGQPPPAVQMGQRVSAIGMRARRQATTSEGFVTSVHAATLATSFEFPVDSSGGPVFAADGAVLGLASIAAGVDRDDLPVVTTVRAGAVCEVLSGAQSRMSGTPPSATYLPVEPDIVVSEDDVREAVKNRAGSLAPPKLTMSGFEVEFLTPVIAHAAMQQSVDFGQWTGYVADRPAVLLVRVAPRQVESLWLKVARGAAMTQGIALPPITHYEPGFARMRVTCGGRELVPIHPFVVERRISESAAIREGLYVFAADAIGPHCGAVKFEVFSEKAPDKGQTAAVDARVVERVWQDLSPYLPDRTPR